MNSYHWPTWKTQNVYCSVRPTWSPLTVSLVHGISQTRLLGGGSHFLFQGIKYRYKQHTISLNISIHCFIAMRASGSDSRSELILWRWQLLITVCMFSLASCFDPSCYCRALRYAKESIWGLPVASWANRNTRRCRSPDFLAKVNTWKCEHYLECQCQMQVYKGKSLHLSVQIWSFLYHKTSKLTSWWLTLTSSFPFLIIIMYFAVQIRKATFLICINRLEIMTSQDTETSHFSPNPWFSRYLNPILLQFIHSFLRFEGLNSPTLGPKLKHFRVNNREQSITLKQFKMLVKVCI